ncbi:MAG TPA: NAD-dependent epimerase/dehydratase family protein, partial [Chthoniobacterales bacterium]
MRILISGSSGTIGSALAASLSSEGQEVVRLVRSNPRGPGEIRWDPQGDFIDRAGIEGMDAVVHLAGESLADGRWTAGKKDRIRDTRVRGTRLLS